MGIENRKFSKEEMYGISSEGKITPGYWLCEINPIPLYSELYSYEADGFESENEQILKVIKAVKVQTNNRGILI